jgi:hypothetical protein
MDGTGNVYVIGTTSSPDFPTHNPLQPHYRDVVCGDLGLHCADVFVAKLQPNGRTLLWSTYLGGSHRDAGGGITLDRASNVYLTGDTYSADFPLTNAWDSTFESYQDAFVAKLNASGTGLIYSTYLGGGSGEEGRSIAVDSSGNAYITGHTRSSDFPLKQAVQARFNEGRDLCDIPCPDAFVTKLTANGTDVVYSTFLGSGYLDFGVDIAVDRAGSAYVTGYTGADDFPTTSGAFQPASAGNDAFVTKFYANGQALMYSTYL